MRSCLLTLALLFLLSGCQSPYQRQGLGGGYSEDMIALDTYIITFRASHNTPDEKIFGYLHKRAAELASQTECNYYAVIADSANSAGGISAESIAVHSDKYKVRAIKIRCYRAKPANTNNLYEVGN